MQGLRRLAGVLDELLFPERIWCMTCEERSCGELLCASCREKVSRLRLQEQTADVRSAFEYQDEVRELIHAYKFSAVDSAAQILVAAMAEVAREMCLPPDTVVTWVTMPERRRRARGMDHGRLLAELLAAGLGLPVRQLLVRTGRARTQHTLNAAQRRTNLRSVFAATGPIMHPVLIVDDVYTTGATMQICSDVLRDAGASRVYGLTAARVRGILS